MASQLELTAEQQDFLVMAGEELLIYPHLNLQSNMLSRLLFEPKYQYWFDLSSYDDTVGNLPQIYLILLGGHWERAMSLVGSRAQISEQSPGSSLSDLESFETLASWCLDDGYTQGFQSLADNYNINAEGVLENSLETALSVRDWDQVRYLANLRILYPEEIQEILQRALEEAYEAHDMDRIQVLESVMQS